jgi:hypothetical protein
MEATMEVLIQLTAGALLLLGSALVLRFVALADGVLKPAKPLRLVPRRSQSRRQRRSRLREAA